MTRLLELFTVGVALICVDSEFTLCSDGWVAFHGSCYLIPHNQAMTFVEAEHFCREHESHVVRVDNQLESAFLREYQRGLKAEEHWLGINDIMIEGVWAWHDTDKQANFTDWLPGQPGSEAGDEDCAVMAPQFDYQWADLPCSVKREPLCETSGKYDESMEVIG